MAPPAGLQARHPDTLACVPLDVSDLAAVHEGVDLAVDASGRLEPPGSRLTAPSRFARDTTRRTTRSKGH
ncbi:hypothetical protein FHU36_001694 [Nonomuraea muscovyensis]|uniref:Uncharacterized protein n=1 Tax=Nonomuraea muscovyensis TaxID=1124761 RepID=A0A7X0EXV4_9ACTN|nr:hypothetical protein [Nonomuraea muscovyensis]